ncbi:hypothetical protein NDA16_002848 [Ustilago loliicola]|nr:hypothetical protein NDA16_002848 [Ustilago loliicola]
MFTKWPVQGDNVKTSDVGETCKDKIADVVIFSPVRNPKDSGWYWEYDVQGYPSMQSTTRAASQPRISVPPSSN